MLLFMKKHLALAAALVIAAGAGTGCSGKKKEEGPGSAKVNVSVSSAQAIIADIDRIEVTISEGAVSPTNPAMTAISATLTKAPQGNQWTGHVTNIPVGTDRVFKAEAFKADNTKVYEGETIVAIAPASTAQVSIILQELNVPPGTENYAPVITSLTSTDAYVKPSTELTFAVGAVDLDHNGEPLAYQWSATCDAGAGSFTAGATTPTAKFKAPAQNATCTIAIRVSETGIADPLSVTTVFTITVNANFGDAAVAAFPNSAPIISLRGDFDYNSDAKAGPIGQEADLFFTAMDPDGDNVRYDLTTVCGGVTVAPSPTPGLPPFPQGVTYTTTSSPGVVPPGAFTSVWNPTFRGYTDPSVDCKFTLVVHDLCTNGNCGAPGTQGARADGAEKVTTIAGVSVTSATTGVLTAPASSAARKAPHIASASAPTDSSKVITVQPSTVYNLSIDAADLYEHGALTAQWVCTAGSPVTSAGVNNVGVGTENLKTNLQWTSPATLTVGMECTATITSAASGLSSAFTFRFAGSDPCIGQADGAVCDDGNACTTGTTCSAGVCGGGTTTTCGASDQCHVAGVCNPIDGTCSNPAAANGTLCNADSNACTPTDVCQAGSCVADPTPVTCVASGQCHTAGVCQPATGTCTNPPAVAGTPCSDGSLCSQLDACDGSGVCVGSAPVVCSAPTACQASVSCEPTTGACTNVVNQPDGTACSDSNACTQTDSCVAGACNGANPVDCSGQPGSVCNPSSGSCVESVATAQLAKRLEVNYKGLAQNFDGTVVSAGKLFTPTKTFDGVSLTSAGAGDLFLAKYTAAGSLLWAKNFGDAADQDASGTAVTADGTIATIGFFTGSLAPATLSTASPTPVDYLLLVDGATGNQKAGGAVFNNGIAGRLTAVAANPNLNLIAVCGYASQAATDLVPGAAFGGGTEDIVIALFDSSGTRLWSRQIGAGQEERCDALTIDEVGNVYAAGRYDGTLDLGLGALPNPASSVRRWIWVSKLNGINGATLSNASFGSGAGNHTPKGLAVDAAGNLFIAGFMSNTLNFSADAANLLTTAGGSDAFVAKLGAGFSHLWSARMGASGPDELRGLALDSFGNPVVVGLFNTPLGTPTTGFAALTAAASTASDAFVVKLNGATGAPVTGGARAYGDANSQSANAVCINRNGAGALLNDVVFSGAYAGGIDFGAAGALTTTGTDTYLTFAELQ